jgi:phosphoribosylanthranilate isomerase
MIVQIYTIQTQAEALALVKMGVDYIGLIPAAIGLPGEVRHEQARLIFTSIGNQAVKVALTVESDLNKISRMVSTVQPDILHLAGEQGSIPPENVIKIKRAFPSLKIMQAVPVVGQHAVEIARSYEEIADFLIVDSYSKNIEGIGAAGVTHDWSISREIVRQSRLPVILAGGLSPLNVEEAIRFVKPAGVDSFTLTNLPLPGGKFTKDLESVRAFTNLAHTIGDQIFDLLN